MKIVARLARKGVLGNPHQMMRRIDAARQVYADYKKMEGIAGNIKSSLNMDSGKSDGWDDFLPDRMTVKDRYRFIHRRVGIIFSMVQFFVLEERSCADWFFIIGNQRPRSRDYKKLYENICGCLDAVGHAYEEISSGLDNRAFFG